jgi:hypothetical protein
MTSIAFTQKIFSSNPGLSELQEIAEKSATSILQKIKEREKSIAEAKSEAQLAADIKTGFWRIGNTDEKLDATANALVKTNAALAEMNDLIQESIKFTCTSLQFAQVMHKTMAHLMVTGFKDANGNIQNLAGESKEFVQLILDEAEDFVSKQQAVEERQTVLNARLDHKERTDAVSFSGCYMQRMPVMKSRKRLYNCCLTTSNEKINQILTKVSLFKNCLNIPMYGRSHSLLVFFRLSLP